MGVLPAAEYSVEPLGDHDRASFSCGIPELDHYLHVQARQDARRKVAAPFVMIDTRRHILGYYTLSAFGIRVSQLPLEIARKLPKYPLIPATLLGRLAISREHQGKKLGQWLLMDALHRSWRNTVEIASVGVVAEAVNDAARAFYLHHEFIAMAEQPRKFFIAMRTIERAFS